jgi:tRNA-binding protein
MSTLYHTPKKVLAISGPDVEEFLNGLTSNVMSSSRNAFLNIHGRIIAVVDQYADSAATIKLCVEEEFVNPLVTHLDRYARLAGVSVRVSDEIVYVDIGQARPDIEGARVLARSAGWLVISPVELAVGKSEEDFRLFRVRHGIPVQGVDFRNEFALNVSLTDFMSFTKGCYLGQEPISKVYHRSRPSWRLEVKAERDCDAVERTRMTSRVFDAEQGDYVGFVMVDQTAGVAKETGSQGGAERTQHMVTIEDFMKLELVIGKIKTAAPHPDADKLLVLTVDIGDQERQLVAGIKKSYAPDDLIGQSVVMIKNLQPVLLRGVESQGMILAASADGGPILIGPKNEVSPGTRVK